MDGDGQVPSIKPLPFLEGTEGRHEVQARGTRGDCTAGVHTEEGGIHF